jgi:hypothetical protein
MNKNPIKQTPARVAGQSLTERMELLWDKVMKDIMVISILSLAITYIWLYYLFDIGHHPYFMTLILGGGILFLALRIRKTLRKYRNHKQGCAGERAVAEYLDEWKSPDFRVIHDLKWENHNVDHVIIAQQGVFAVETKTYSRFSINEDDLRQARSGAYDVSKLILEHFKKHIWVTPILAFPGHWISEEKPENEDGVWVLNPKRRIGVRIMQQKEILSRKDVNSIFNFLKNFNRKEKT